MAKRHVELTSSISRWLSAAGINDDDVRADLSVDLADLLHAAEVARSELEQLLQLSVAEPREAEDALQRAANIEVQLFTELKHHLEGLEKHWPLVMETLDGRGA